MEKEDFSAPLRNTVEGIKSYVAQQVAYNKLVLSKKMTELSARLVLFLLIFGISGLILLFLSFSFANWYAYTYGELFEGYLILVAFYLLLAAIIYIFRKQLIFKPIRTITGKILFSEENDQEIAATFNSIESLNIQIIKSREVLKQEEENLKESLDELSQTFTLPNIIQKFAKNAYESILTTSNIARLTYVIVQKLKRKKKPKQLND
jgi:hypothetical protein